MGFFAHELPVARVERPGLRHPALTLSREVLTALENVTRNFQEGALVMGLVLSISREDTAPESAPARDAGGSPSWKGDEEAVKAVRELPAGKIKVRVHLRARISPARDH